MTQPDSNLLNPYSEIESGYQEILYSHGADSAEHYDLILHESSGAWEDVLENSEDACGTINDTCYLGPEIKSVLDELQNTECLSLKSENDEFYLFIGRSSGYLIDKTVRTPEYLVGELRSWESGSEKVPDWRIRAESRNPSFLKTPLERP